MYAPPIHNAPSFTCPICEVYAQQIWGKVRLLVNEESQVTRLDGARCMHCQSVSLWNKKKRMVYPAYSVGPEAAKDMPADVKEVYEEARSIATMSPRAAVALLRLALQVLLTHVGGKGENINEDIAQLVKVSLPSTHVQKALDSVRLIGNNAVHPGTIQIQDNPQMANTLFKLLNYIVSELITRPKELDALYNSLPPSSLEAIKKRDGEA